MVKVSKERHTRTRDNDRENETKKNINKKEGKSADIRKDKWRQRLEEKRRELKENTKRSTESRPD